MHTFSESELASFDGSDPDKPLYLAVNGDVFDVSSNPRIYGKVSKFEVCGDTQLIVLAFSFANRADHTHTLLVAMQPERS